MSGLAVFLFGKPRVERDDAPITIERRKGLALLAYLAVTRQPFTRDALVALLWPELDSHRGRAALRSTLTDLHHAIGSEGWAVAGDEVALSDDVRARVDVVRFRVLLAQVAAHAHTPDSLCDDCLAALIQAVDLYRDHFLAGFTLADSAEFDAWQTFETESLRLELAGALQTLAASLAGRGEYDPAIGYARRWLALDPLHEAAHRHLMQLHTRAGDRATAIRQYQECVRVLAEELGMEPEPQTIELFEAIRAGGNGEHPPPLSLGSSPTLQLPPDITPFIGRETELAQVSARLNDPTCRLLTILGPGGIGKTRLAIQAARTEASRFVHGACFIDLAPISSAEFLATTILRTLEAPSYGAADVDEHILRYLADKQMLLILDNYEHLLTGPDPDRRDGYGLVTKILEAAPRTKLLVTSRTRLNVRAEWLEPLEGLDVPMSARAKGNSSGEPRRLPSAESKDVLARGLESFSATALFLACMQRVRPDFRPTADEGRHIVHICRLLEGMPLGIELAAAWARTLPLKSIADELERGPGVLTATARDVPARHRSMAAAIDHSWRLLSPREQGILRQLSVFRGGCTIETAGAVAGADYADLSRLIDASWLRPAEGGRYRMHEVIRQYCAAKLETEHEAATGEPADRVRDRHMTFYRSLLLARQGEFLRRPESASEMAAEYDNLLAAWDWSMTADDFEAARTMTPGLSWIDDLAEWGRVFRSRLAACARKLREDAEVQSADPGWDRERALLHVTLAVTIMDDLDALPQESWQAWLKEAVSLLPHGDVGDPLTGNERWKEIGWKVHFRVAGGQRRLGHFAESARQFAVLTRELEGSGLRLWPYTEEARFYWQAKAYMWWGFSTLHLGRYEEARYLAEQCLISADLSGVPSSRWQGLFLLACVLTWTGNGRQAEVHLREALRIARTTGSKNMVASTFLILGTAWAEHGSYRRARACFQRTLEWSRESGQLLASCLLNLGGVQMALGNLTEARRLYQQAVHHCQKTNTPVGLATTLIGLARVALATGNLVKARTHLRAALQALGGSDAMEWVINALAAVAELLQVEGQAEIAAELCAALLSWPATPPYAPDTMQHLRLELELRLRNLSAQLPPEVFAAATARGRNHEVDDALAIARANWELS